MILQATAQTHWPSVIVLVIIGTCVIMAIGKLIKRGDKMLTLREANELNFDKLTIKDLQTLYGKYGYIAIVNDGELKGFTMNN